MAQAAPSIIVTESEAAEALRLSARSLQRMRVDGSGPPFVQLTPRRVGYAINALRDWATSRTVASTAVVTTDKTR